MHLFVCVCVCVFACVCVCVCVCACFPACSSSGGPRLPPHSVDVLSVKAFLHSKGISCSHKKNPGVASLLDSMQPVPGAVSLPSLLTVPLKDNTITKAIIGRLA